MISANLKKVDNELYEDFGNFVALKDSIYDVNVTANLTEFETKYRTAEKEAQIIAQDLQLQKEKSKRNLAMYSLAFLLLLGGSGIWINQNKQKQKQLKVKNEILSLQQSLSIKELETLNKQLDPHEIKNLLAGISPEIQEKAPEAYRKMVKLLKLTKASLNSGLTEPVKKQVEQIQDFLELEKNMLSVPLDFAVKNNLPNENLEIPRLLLKNLVENSIKHGIKGKEDGGEIFVGIDKEDDFVNIVVEDTGRGRLDAISLDSGIGTSTYQKLFKTLNLRNKQKASFEIIDKKQGTKVLVKIPLEYKYV